MKSSKNNNQGYIAMLMSVRRYALFSIFCLFLFSNLPTAKAASLSNMAVIGNPSIASGVDYQFEVSRVQITVGDWVDFLNAVQAGRPGKPTNLGGNCPSGSQHLPYTFNGSTWSIKRDGICSDFTTTACFHTGSMGFTTSEARNLPADCLTLNQVAHYMNWLSSGDVDTGAYTFNTAKNGNSGIKSFDKTFTGPRLPTEAELNKAMYWKPGTGFVNYPNGTNSAPGCASVNDWGGLYNSGSSTALYACGGAAWATQSWAQVGQEYNSMWGLYDMSGNRHEATFDINSPSSVVILGSSAFNDSSYARRGSRVTGFSANQYIRSVGYRIWRGASVTAPQGRIEVTKQVTGGSDSQSFTVDIDCAGADTKYDQLNLKIKHNIPFQSNLIPAGTVCVVTERTPNTAPAGYMYEPPKYSSSQTITIVDKQTHKITITNNMIPAVVNSTSCPAGTVPSPANLVANGDFSTVPSEVAGGGDDGKDNNAPGYFYAAPQFYSQAQYRGFNTYPTDWPASQGDGGTVNKFAIMQGAFTRSEAGYELNQKPFPGDPANNVPSGNYWFYSNGNALGSGDVNGPASAEYLLWEQNLSGLDTSKTYTFSAYISNVLEPVPTLDGAPDDPIVRLRINGVTGKPDGALGFGPYTMTEADTRNSKPLDGWKRVEYAFKPTSSSMKFKFTSAAKGVWGDDFGLTALGVNECIKSVLTVSKTVNGKPLGFSSPNYTLNLSCSNAAYNQTFTLKDGETKTITDIPAGTTCSVTEPGTPTPPPGYVYAPPVISPAVTTSVNSPSNISVTNALTWKNGSLNITKQVSGKPSGFTSPDFTIGVDCSDNSFDQTFTLKDGESKVISNIPENTSCTVSEPSIPAAPYGYTYLTPAISPGTVSILGNQTIAVTVTNTLEEMCIVQEDNILNASSPTYGVEQGNLLANDEYVYMPLVQRSGTPLWSGNLKKFLRKSGRIYNANGTTEAVDSEGQFTSGAKDIWSTSSSADGRDISKGGAANKLPLPDSRNLYTDKNNGQIIEMKAPGVTPAMFGATGAAERNQLLDFIRGKNTDGTPRYHMGDILNGKAELVTYGSGAYVFVATNEGYLHAIDASTGVEKWAFMPNSLLKNVKAFYENNQTGVHVAGIDGAINIWRFPHDQNSNGILETGEFATYLYFGLREGGAEYYMLDISNIQVAPSVVWHITSNSSGFAEMGQAWSAPARAKMRVAKNKPENTATHASELKDVLVFGGGYNTIGLPQGRTVFIVDALTGSLIWSLRDISGATDGLSPATALTNSIPGNIRVLDMDRNGALDRLYFADTGGNVWRVDMDVDVSDGKPASADTYYDYSKARLSKFASLGGSGADSRMFFFEPDVSLMDYQGKTVLLLSIGSGNRTNALDMSVDDRFYVMIDRNPYLVPDSSLFPVTHGSALASIDDASALGSGLLANTSLRGWFHDLPNTGEKVLASAMTTLNKVVFTSFTPGSVTVGATCDQRAAKARAYVVDLFTGKAVADLDRSGGVERSVIAAENEVLDTGQLVFNNPSTVDNRACSNMANCTSQYVEVRVGRMSRPLIDNSNVLVTGSVDGEDMDIGQILPRAFWRDQLY